MSEWQSGEKQLMIYGMNARAKKLLQDVLELPRKDRAAFAHDVLLSLEDGPDEAPEVVERAWAEEIERRVADLKEGRAEVIPAEQVFREARERSKRARAQRR